MDKSFFNLGVQLAAHNYKKSAKEILSLASFNDELNNPRNTEFGCIQKIACKIAASVFDETGRKNEFIYHVFDKLASTKSWDKSFNVFSDAVFIAVGKVANETAEQVKTLTIDSQVKCATSLVTNALAAGSKTIPEVSKNVAGASVLGGGLLGSIYWLLNRHANEDETNSEVIKAKIKNYNRLANEIKSQLHSNPDADTEEVKEMVQNSIY